MQNSTSLTAQDSNETFLDTMSALEKKGMNQTPMPQIIKLDGNSGLFITRKYDADAKKMVAEFFEGGKGWTGTILLVKWFAQGKYEPGNKIVSRTREFFSFRDEPVELLQMDYAKSKEERTTVAGSYESYPDFKNAFTTKNPLSGKESSPFDLWFSVYVYNWSTNEIVNLRGKGTSRSNLFTYLGSYKGVLERKPKALAEVKTMFGSEAHDKPKSSTAQDNEKYHAISFTSLALNPSEEVTLVKNATINLMHWMDSFKSKDANGQPTRHEIVEDEIDHGVGGDQEIRLEDIPF